MQTHKFRPGMHLKAPRSLYSHHGVAIDFDFKGVLWVAQADTPLTRQGITAVPFDEFAQGGPVEQVAHADGLPPHIVIARAKSRLGENKYCPFSNNCEHFANWCATGRAESFQVRTLGLLTALGLVIWGIQAA